MATAPPAAAVGASLHQIFNYTWVIVNGAGDVANSTSRNAT
jgi:hypothetical protein